MIFGNNNKSYKCRSGQKLNEDGLFLVLLQCVHTTTNQSRPFLFVGAYLAFLLGHHLGCVWSDALGLVLLALSDCLYF